MDTPAAEIDGILWSGTCSWYRIIAWRWTDVCALVFLSCAMIGFQPLLGPLDSLGEAVAKTWFGWNGWREALPPLYEFLAMGAVAGWFAGRLLGAFLTHIGRRFYLTRDRMFWGNRGETFSAPLSSIASVHEGRAFDGGTVRLEFSDGRRDLLIAGVPFAHDAAAFIRQAGIESLIADPSAMVSRLK